MAARGGARLQLQLHYHRVGGDFQKSYWSQPHKSRIIELNYKLWKCKFSIGLVCEKNNSDSFISLVPKEDPVEG